VEESEEEGRRGGDGVKTWEVGRGYKEEKKHLSIRSNLFLSRTSSPSMISTTLATFFFFFLGPEAGARDLSFPNLETPPTRFPGFPDFFSEIKMGIEGSNEINGIPVEEGEGEGAPRGEAGPAPDPQEEGEGRTAEFREGLPEAEAWEGGWRDGIKEDPREGLPAGMSWEEGRWREPRAEEPRGLVRVVEDRGEDTEGGSRRFPLSFS
jgi:hypothetical protein